MLARLVLAFKETNYPVELNSSKQTNKPKHDVQDFLSVDAVDLGNAFSFSFLSFFLFFS